MQMLKVVGLHLMYLTILNINKHINLANTIREYAKKSSLDFRGILSSCKFLLSGECLKECLIKLDDIQSKQGSYKNLEKRR